MRDAQRARRHPVGLERVEHGVDLLAWAGDDCVARPVAGRDRHGGGELRPHVCARSGDHGHGAAGREILHQPRPLGDEEQRILEVEDPGRARSRIFTDAVAGDGVGLDAPASPELGESELHRHDGRLSIECLIEQRSAGAEDDFQQPGAQRAREDRVRAVEEAPEYGPAKGTLVIQGGGSDAGTGIFETFINKAGGLGAKIVVVPTAGGNKNADGTVQVYTEDRALAMWKKRGATNVRLQAARKQPLLEALTTAWRNTAPKKLVQRFEIE